MANSSTETKPSADNREAGRDSSREKQGRSGRIPLGRARQKLSVQKIDGYVTRWINDQAGRVQTAISGGYEFVDSNEVGHIGESNIDGNDDVGSRVRKSVGTGENNQPLYAYLMKIKKEFYDEDQMAKSKQINEVENAIRTGKQEDGSNDETTYTPRGVTNKLS